MRLLVDQNLSHKLPQILQDTFPEMQHVAALGMDDASDHTIWEFAQNGQWHLLTKDGDFKVIQLLQGYPPKIIWLRCGNVSTWYICQLLLSHQTEIQAFLNKPEGGTLEIHE